MNRPAPLVYAGLLALLGAAVAGGQDLAGSFAGGVTRVLGEEHFLGSSESYGRLVCGDVTGDLRDDGVLMFGDQPVLVYGPGLYHSLGDYPVTATDVAVHRSSKAGQPGRTALVSERGLELWMRHPIDGSFSFQTLGGSAWVDARRVMSADINADGRVDLVGIGADGVTILMLLQDFSGGYVPASFQAPSEVVDVALIDWVGGPTLELALNTLGGVVIMATSGAQLAALSPAAVDAICPFRQQDHAHERLALFLQTTQSAGGPIVVLADSSGFEPLPGFSEAGDVVGMTAGDIDLDGNDELVLARAVGDLILLRNRAPLTPTFLWAASDSHWLDPSPGDPAPASVTGAAPGLADLDGDSDLDILCTDPATQAVIFYRNGRVDHRDYTFGLLGGSYEKSPTSGLDELRLVLKPPPIVNPAADNLEVVIWEQESPTSPMTSTALIHTFPSAPAGGPTVIKFPIGDSESPSKLYSIEIRHAVKDPGGPVIAVAPTEVFCFGIRGSSVVAIAEIHDIPASNIYWLSNQNVGLGGLGVIGIGPGIVPLGCVPCFADDDFPDPFPSDPPP